MLGARGIEAQRAFDFLRDPPDRARRPERLFFCVMPDGEAAEPFGRLARDLVAGCAPGATLLPAGRLHVSLHLVRDDVRLREKYIFAARQAARRVALPPFEQCFRHATGFRPLNPRRGRHPLVLLGEGEAIRTLHRQLVPAMAATGLHPSDDIVPHMTLAYVPMLVPLQAIAPMRFEVRELLLVHSRRGLSEYRVIDRWPLRG